MSLDIIGRIPTLAEIRRFEKNSNRRATINNLLASGEFPRFWSEVWTATLNGYSNAFDSDRRECHEAGMDGHLRKPLETDKLMEILNMYLELESGE